MNLFKKWLFMILATFVVFAADEHEAEQKEISCIRCRTLENLLQENGDLINAPEVILLNLTSKSTDYISGALKKGSCVACIPGWQENQESVEIYTAEPCSICEFVNQFIGNVSLEKICEEFFIAELFYPCDATSIIDGIYMKKPKEGGSLSFVSLESLRNQYQVMQQKLLS